MCGAQRYDPIPPRHQSGLDSYVEALDRALFDDGVLLCSEAEPDRCHRRLAAEYLQHRWGGVEIVHLG